MKALDALNILSDPMASQHGMVTTAQAEAIGVDRYTLSRLERNEHIERVISGVYRSRSAPSFREELVYAAWLAMDRKRPAWERPRNAGDVVASHATAAWLLELGELNPEPFTFTCTTRRQTTRTGIRLVKSTLTDDEIVLVSGIPTTSPARTVHDLLRDGEDLSLVSNVLADALANNPQSALNTLRERASKLIGRYNQPTDQLLFGALERKGLPL